MPLRGAALCAALALAILTSCSSTGRGTSTFATGTLVEFADPVGVAVAVGGDEHAVLVGSRSTGEIVRVHAGSGSVSSIARLDVSTEGQRGLLDLIMTADGRLIVAWTDLDLTLRVDEVDLVDGSLRPIWTGPQSSSGANGGRLVDVPDRGIVIGVGTLRRGALVADPEAANGKLLLLDPAGPPDQTPVVVSSGWNNPFALAIDDSGALWVADNDPGDDPERLARGDDPSREPLVVAEMPRDTAPSGMAVLADGRLVVCSFLTGDLLIFDDVPEGADPSLLRRVPADCSLGVVAVGADQVLVSTATEVVVVDL